MPLSARCCLSAPGMHPANAVWILVAVGEHVTLTGSRFVRGVGAAIDADPILHAA